MLTAQVSSFSAGLSTSSSDVRLRALLLSFGLLSLIGCACGAEQGEGSVAGLVEARARLFPTARHSPLSRKLAQPRRWVAIFHPDMENCQPREAAVLRVLRRVVGEFPDLEVVMTMPDALERLTELRGEALVGERVLLSADHYAAEGQLSPRPRLEIWAGDGRLLLLRSLPPVFDEAQLEQEVRWTRAFTAPLPESAL